MNIVIARARKDAIESMEKLVNCRQREETQDYRTLSDILETLLKLNSRNTVKLRYTDNQTSFTYYDHETMIFLERMVSDLLKEIKSLTEAMSKFFFLNDLRTYKDLLISFEKLTSMFDRLNSEYSESKYKIKKYDIFKTEIGGIANSTVTEKQPEIKNEFPYLESIGIKVKNDDESVRSASDIIIDLSNQFSNLPTWQKDYTAKEVAQLGSDKDEIIAISTWIKIQEIEEHMAASCLKLSSLLKNISALFED